MKLLTAALQQRKNDLRRVVDRLRNSETLSDEDGWLLREATELVGCLRRLVGFSARTPKEIHDAFGAPGDFGYETPIGEALAKIYRGDSAVLCQRCGKLGGGVAKYKLGGLLFSQWECPHCPPVETPEGAVPDDR